VFSSSLGLSGHGDVEQQAQADRLSDSMKKMNDEDETNRVLSKHPQTVIELGSRDQSMDDTANKPNTHADIAGIASVRPPVARL
jgi:hypothetical protein